MNNQIKPAWQTCEFWLIVLTNIAAVVVALQGIIKPETYLIIMAILNGLFAVLRTLLKKPEITTLIDNSTKVETIEKESPKIKV